MRGRHFRASALDHTWAAAGDKYRYFMVFAHDPLGGTYSIGDFKQVLDRISLWPVHEPCR